MLEVGGSSGAEAMARESISVVVEPYINDSRSCYLAGLNQVKCCTVSRSATLAVLGELDIVADILSLPSSSTSHHSTFQHHVDFIIRSQYH